MKKNYMMRLAAVLLVLVLLSTCVISGTFAKYVTAGEKEDSAKVANWGVTVTVNKEDEAFGKSYVDEITDQNCTVKAKGEYDVLAPGTNGTLFEYAITGKPEVSVNVKVAFTLTLANWAVDGDANYCPLVFKVGTTEFKKADNETVADFVAKVEAAVNFEANYNPNQDIAKDLVVTWSWAFEGDNDKDTALGNAANKATVAFTLDVTVTQIN